jgi:hypothetical protein
VDEYLRKSLSYFFLFIAPALVIVGSALSTFLFGMLAGIVWLGIGVFFATPQPAQGP